MADVSTAAYMSSRMRIVTLTFSILVTTSLGTLKLQGVWNETV